MRRLVTKMRTLQIKREVINYYWVQQKSFAARYFHCSIKEELKCLAAKMKASHGAEKIKNKDVNKGIKILFM